MYMFNLFDTLEGYKTLSDKYTTQLDACNALFSF